MHLVGFSSLLKCTRTVKTAGVCNLQNFKMRLLFNLVVKIGIEFALSHEMLNWDLKMKLQEAELNLLHFNKIPHSHIL